MTMLLDHSNLDPGPFAAGGAANVGSGLPAYRSRLGEQGAVAVVATNPAVYGCIRMLLAFAEIESGRPGAPRPQAPMRLFDDREKAVAWLRSLRAR